MRARRWRVMAGVVAVVATLGLVVACGDDDDGGTGAGDTTSTPASDIKAGLVSDVGKFNDRSFNQSALEEIGRAHV